MRPKTLVAIRIDKELKTKLEKFAKKYKLLQSEVFRIALAEHVSRLACPYCHRPF